MIETEAAVSEPQADEAGGSRRRYDGLYLYVPFVAAVALTFASSPDDTLITLRYAYNLLHGHGLVFNPRQHVNGATSPVGVVLGVVALLLPGGYTLLKAKLLSLLFGFLTVRAGRRLLELLDLDRKLYVTGLVALGLSSPIAFAAATGLETTVASFAVASLVVEVMSGRAFRRPAWAVLAAALAVAARPEAIALVALMAAVALFQREHPWPRRMLFLAGGAGMEAVLVAWNQLYYGSLVPNTYQAKHTPQVLAFHEGLHYLATALYPGYYSPGLIHRVGQVLLIGLELLILAGALSILLRRRRATFVLAPVVAQALFILDTGGDWMTGARFLEPVAPELVAVALIGATALAPHGSTGWRRTTVPVAGGLLVLATAFSYVPAAGRAPVTGLAHGLSTYDLVAHGDYGLSTAWANQTALLACAPNGSLVGDTEVGYSGFADERLRILDLRGLTNRPIAYDAPRKDRGDVGVVVPDWTQPNSVVGKVILEDRPVLVVTLDHGGAPTVLDHHYRLLGTHRYQGGTTFYVYERSDMHCPAPAFKG